MRKLNPYMQVALTANIFEWYEFALTGYMALEIGRLFFPRGGDQIAVILSFSVFAVSYVARPIGGIFLGLWGNKRGAAAALKLSMLLMAVPTVAIAVLPTYTSVGYWATGALLALKMLQGFGAGGEVPMNAHYVSQNVPDQSRGFYCAMVATSGFIGMLFASLVVFLLPFMIVAISSRLPAWLLASRLGETWRWPFLLSLPLSLLIMRIRSSLPDRPANRMPAVAVRAGKPVVPILQAIVLVGFMAAHLNTVFVWLPNYLHVYLGVALDLARMTNVASLIGLSITILCAGYCVRWIDARKLAFAGTCAMLLSTYPLFMVLQRADSMTVFLAQIGFALSAGMLIGVIFVLLVDLFEPNWGSLGVGAGFGVPTALFGGTAPVVSSYLIERTQLLVAPALYITALGLFALPVAYRLAFNARAQGAEVVAV
jgi:MHS family proline/betaine transporter-like MFS transporter